MDVHLLDGTFELFRAHFGAPSARSPSDIEVGATRAFGRSLLTLLRQNDVSHVACAFDQVIESFRNQLFDGYKTGDDIEPELWAQFPLVERMASALGVVIWPMVEFEADDALASGALKYSGRDELQRVVLCSPDKDLAQVISGDRIVGWDRIRDSWLNEAGVWAKFGVGPESIPDYLALVGDTADGIPGLQRWGAKSSSTLLAEYTHLENIPPLESDWSVKVRGAAALAAVLREHIDDALLYRRLATLRTDVPIDESLEDLRWRGADRAQLEELCNEIGDTRLVDRVHCWRD